MKKLSLIFGIVVSIQVNASGLSCGMAELVNLPPEELMRLKVSSANKTSTCINQAPSTIVSYGYKDIQHLGARTLSDMLWLVAGLQMQTSPNGRDRLWIRGVQSEFDNKVALYIDNVPIKDAFGGFAIDEELPVESIEKVEIIKGPGLALYGANAFSGVINIFTFQAGKIRSDGNPSEVKLKNQLKLGIGENNTHLSYGTVEQNLAQAVDVKLEGKWLETDRRKPDHNRAGQPNNRSNTQELGYAHLSLSALDGDLLFNAFYSQFDNARVDKPLPLQNAFTNNNMRFSLNYRHAFSEQLKFDFNAYHTSTERLEHEIRYFSDGSLRDDNQYINLTNLSGVYSTLHYQPVESNQIVAGFELKREEEATSVYLNLLNNQFVNFTLNPAYQDLGLMSYSFFLQDTQNIFSPQTQLTAGVRFDVLDLFHNQFNYRIGLTHSFDNGFYGKLLYGTAYRAPSFIEFSRVPVGTALPNVETMRTFEVTLGYQTEKLRLNLTTYYNNYHNLLERSNSFNKQSQTLGDNSDIFGNFDHQSIIGAEFEGFVTLTKNWKGFLNASWTHAKSFEADQKLPLLADWTVASGIEWNDKICNGDLVFNNQVIVYGQRRDWQNDIWFPGQQMRYPNRSGNLNDGFATWNSSLHYQLPLANHTQSLTFDLTAHNLLDKKYYTQSLISPTSNAVANFDTQYQGRQVRFSITYSW